MYGMVPAIWPTRWVESRALATPKSITRAPPGPRMMLAGLKSQWITRAWWIASRAVSAWLATSSSSLPPSGPCSRTRSARVRPSMYSLTMYGTSPTTSKSSTLAVTNWATLRALTSSRSRLRRSTPLASQSIRRTLTATRLPSSSAAR